MVTVEIIRTQEVLQIADTDITYVKQVADFGDITKANASYTPNFTVPKTPHNTQVLENLGIAGDTSRAPYKKLECRLLDNGTAIVERGLLNIQATEEEYKIHIQEGIVEFFKDMSNDKIGEVLDLRPLNHMSNLDTVIASFTNSEPYSYTLADFNGPKMPDAGGTTNLDIEALVPAFNCKWMWDRIFQYYGWKAEGPFDFEEMAELWMSYPTALQYENDATIDTLASMELKDVGKMVSYGLTWVSQWSYINNTVDPAYGELTTNGWEYEVRKSGYYQIRFRVNGGRHASLSSAAEEFSSFLIINKVIQERIIHNSYNADSVSYFVNLEAGDLLWIGGDDPNYIMKVTGGEWHVEKAGVQVNFNEALIKYKVRDFIKEMMLRHALTPFPDVENRVIKFMTMKQRLEAAPVDWSSKYNRRKGESYLYGNYSQNNYLKQKYDQDFRDYADGNIMVNNKNLPVEQTLFDSEIYAPEPQPSTWIGTAGEYAVPHFRLYSTEATKKADGTIEVKYRALEDRFFIFKQEWSTETIHIMNQLINGFPIARIHGSTFKDVIGLKYQEAKTILDDARVHDLELNLTQYDIATVPLGSRFYFKQENAIYLLNKVTWKSGEAATGEFIKTKE